MSKVKRIVFALICALVLFGFLAGGFIYSKRLTYQEYEDFSSENEDGLVEIPYTYLYRFSLSSDEREGGLCDITLRDLESGDALYFWPNVQVPVMEEGALGVRALPTRLRDKLRSRKIGTKCVLEAVRKDGGEVHWTSLRVYGGNPDGFWLRIWIFYGVFTALLLFRVYVLLDRGSRFREDPVLAAILTAFVYFLMMSCFVSTNFATVIDENDNILGGMLMVRQGRTLYLDYYTQHMPAVYWVCGIYALLGAGSIYQMRLLFFLSMALVYGLVVFRHFTKPYRWRLIAALLLTGPLTVLVSAFSASQILSDTVQAAALLVLLLEFADYLSDHLLDAKRGLIVGLAVFFSVGSAFLSVYSVAACAAAVIAEELRFRLSEKENRAGLLYYLRFAAFALLPSAAAVLYLIVSGAWQKAVEMAYSFNVEVYTVSYLEPWTSKLQPLADSLKHMLSLFPQTLSEFGQGGTSFLRHGVECALLVIAALSLIAIVLRRRSEEGRPGMGRRVIAALGIFGMVLPLAARGATKFHSLPLWFLVLAICALRTDLCREETYPKERLVSLHTAASLALLLLALPMLYFHAEYVHDGFGDLSGETVRADTHQLLELTEEGDAIFLEASRTNPNYLIFKDRLPCNRLLWILPWYMEWYEEDMVDDLKTASPKAASYIERQKIWGRKNYTKKLDAAFKEGYEEKWDTIWVRKDLI